MGFNTPSDPFLAAALWIGAIAVVLTLVVAALIVWLRLGLRRRTHRWDRFVAVWRPLLTAALLEPSPPALPRLGARQHLFFLRLWVYLHESVRGEAADRLNRVARLLGMFDASMRLLHSGSRGARLLAIVGLGHLGDRRAWDALARLAADEDGLVSVNAARALVQIDPFDGARHLMPLILSRKDWDVARVATFLQDARDAFWLLLTKTVPELPEADLPRALRLADALRLTLPTPTMRLLLDARRPARVVAAALRIATAIELADDVRRCLAHPEARVRTEAARQMVQLARAADLPALLALLDDPDWSVRLEAARTLTALPFHDARALTRLQREGTPAHDILRHVLAERALQA